MNLRTKCIRTGANKGIGFVRFLHFLLFDFWRVQRSRFFNSKIDRFGTGIFREPLETSRFRQAGGAKLGEFWHSARTECARDVQKQVLGIARPTEASDSAHRERGLKNFGAARYWTMAY